ncbi:DMT family transporter [Pseudomonas sp. CC6-YY-74]|uniref:DMT family transporter n=1 Tax=Pseudomonas sp. CC6-YY-74 TaxID=1930532 RepID=UPI0009A1AD06|nr:DMT family transporter [Pseudomonas sp. CC6-YY-74]
MNRSLFQTSTATAMGIVPITTIAMLAFAGNSVLCRLALKNTDIDAATFSMLRLASGALVLWLLLALRKRGNGNGNGNTGSWSGALALSIYVVAFTFAYIKLDTGMGALLLFGAVQLSMLAYGFLRGERLAPLAAAGLLLSLAGLVVLLLPGASTPPTGSAALMIAAGLAWAAYSLLGRGVVDPLALTAANFRKAVPIALVLCLPFIGSLRLDGWGAFYAVLSGAVASGLGYAIWYSALRGLSAMQASTVQLSVPILASLAGVALLSEPLTLRIAIASVAVLGGISLVLCTKAKT